MEPSDQIDRPAPFPVRRTAILALILAVAAGLRWWNISAIPPGLWFDEALNGLDAWSVWQPGGGFQLVYPEVFPREPLFVTLLALVFRVADPARLPMRLLCGALGVLTVLALYAMLRREAGPRLALTAAAVLATMRWHVLMSRLAFRTLLLPLWLCLLVWAAFACRRHPTPARIALFGLLVGGGFYTYLAWYFMLPLVLGLMLWVGHAAWQAPARRNAKLALLVCMPLFVVAPLGIHYARHPDHLFARPGAVSPFSPEGGGWAEIAENAGDALLMFHYKGDHVPVVNVPWAPALDPLHGACFLAGLVICLAGMRARRPLPLILLAWIALGMLATVFTRTDSPNFLRTLVITPAVAVVAARGLLWLADALAQATFQRSPAHRPAAAACFAGVLLMLSAGLAARHVLVDWPRHPEVTARFHEPVVQVADHARSAPDDALYFVSRDLGATLPFQFLTLRNPHVRIFEGWDCFAELPDPPSERWILVTAQNGLLQPLLDLVPGGRVVTEFRGEAGNTWALVYAVPESQRPSVDAARAWSPGDATGSIGN